MIDLATPNILGRLVEYRRHSDSAPRTGKIMSVQQTHVLVTIRGVSVAAAAEQLSWPKESVVALRPRETV